MKVSIIEKNYVSVKKVKGIDTEIYLLVLCGNGTIEDAKEDAIDKFGNKLFHDGCYENMAIGNGSIYINTNDIKASIYSEETDSWKTK